ncbi:hypothetical protein [Pseudoxanthomonas sp. X-1]|uniref:MGH1-like glycoside hydrolase domain-containing protein n=1 Tax=Pseudoxanthomonas sp. X-1 TaxID=2571115 RepID=UPI00110B91D5|nr:hypothetical protein [Pseudoxanthomonas sp. X-1]TMN16855.1 hypothetical protein FF950_17850 [Pseudoxanthomonas sp. X-1]UAY75660.1 hypothetical protein LAJ50_05250 [Pseudoxanthomonas sp. X-1]
MPSWTVTAPVQERFLAAHGLRGFAGGYGSDGLELWSFPVQIASGYRLEFLHGDGTPLAAADAPVAATLDPFGLTRSYAAPGLRVSERIEARDTLPGVRVRLRVEQAPPGLRVRVHLVPSLNLMWPAGIGGQEFAWDAAARGLLLQEPSGRFRALIASPQAGAHSEPNNDRRGSAFGRPLFLELTPTLCGGARCATLAFASQSEPGEDVHDTATALLQAPEAPAPADIARLAQATRLRIVTPDGQANRALRWAQVALEQAWSCNARLGCGMVAGYGPSHGARRPQYAWYFGGDGLVSTRALVASGQFERAAAQLAFELRYQDPDTGMLWHELSQSAGFLQWVRDYPHMYAHVDIAFDFLAVTAEYAHASGEDTFLRAHWPQLLAAWRYCRSLIDAGDGLPRVPAGKMSGNEQDALTDELTLSAAWVDAARAMAAMADAQGDAALAAQARADAERARASIRARYRDPAGQWISGFHRDGRRGESFSGADLAAIGSGAATPQEAAAIFAQLAAPDVLTDWGLRSKPASAPDYDSEAYSRGSVWGLGSAAAAEALWRAGRGPVAAAGAVGRAGRARAHARGAVGRGVRAAARVGARADLVVGRVPVGRSRRTGGPGGGRRAAAAHLRAAATGGLGLAARRGRACGRQRRHGRSGLAPRGPARGVGPGQPRRTVRADLAPGGPSVRGSGRAPRRPRPHAPRPALARGMSAPA